MMPADVMPAWERRERARLHRKRCPVCRALPPNHYAGFGCQPMPDPGAPRHQPCGCAPGSLGCRLVCGPQPRVSPLRNRLETTRSP